MGYRVTPLRMAFSLEDFEQQTLVYGMATYRRVVVLGSTSAAFRLHLANAEPNGEMFRFAVEQQALLADAAGDDETRVIGPARQRGVITSQRSPCSSAMDRAVANRPLSAAGNRGLEWLTSGDTLLVSRAPPRRINDRGQPGHGRRPNKPRPGTRAPAQRQSCWAQRAGEDPIQRQPGQPRDSLQHLSLTARQAVRRRSGWRAGPASPAAQQPEFTASYFVAPGFTTGACYWALASAARALGQSAEQLGFLVADRYPKLAICARQAGRNMP